MKLYSYVLCPASRIIRIVLNESSLEYQLINSKMQNADNEFKTEENWLHLPILEIDDKKHTQISGHLPILAYLYEEQPVADFLKKENMESVRIADRFNTKFFAEVSWRLISEKVLTYKEGGHYPDSAAIRSATRQLYSYLEEISWLIDRRTWLAGNDFSIADITAAAHLSCVEYLGMIDWRNYEAVKIWYMSIKSRPSFQPLLSDKIPGINPSQTYTELDF